MTDVSRRGLLAGAGAALTLPVFARWAHAQAKPRITFALSSYPPSIRPWQNSRSDQTYAVTPSARAPRLCTISKPPFCAGDQRPTS